MRKEGIFRRKVNKGFSLVELIIVVAIIAILAATIAPILIRYIDKARKQRDVAVAETIYHAANLALASSDDKVRDSWEQDTKQKKWSVVSNGESYQIEIIAWARGSYDYRKENGEFKNGWNAVDNQWDFVEEFKLNLTQYGGRKFNTENEVVPFKYRKTKDPYRKSKQYADSWILYRRTDNYQMEVWIGTKVNGGGLVEPYYRLFPDTDKRWLK